MNVGTRGTRKRIHIIIIIGKYFGQPQDDDDVPVQRQFTHCLQSEAVMLILYSSHVLVVKESWKGRKGGEKWRCSLTSASTDTEQKEGPFLNSAHPPPVLLSYVYTRRDDDGPKFSAVFFRPKTLAKTLRVFCMLTHMSGIPLLCYVHSVCVLFFILLENR